MTIKKVVKKEKVAEQKKPVPTKNVNIQLNADDSKPFERAAQVLTASGVAAYRVISSCEQANSAFVDSSAMLSCLSEQAAKVVTGDLSQVESMLVNQAVALQSLFSKLAERGMYCDTTTAFELNLRIALRAQSQCRATLETLAAIKNPPIVYAKQANIASGHQQVNNGVSHPREIENAQSKLSANGINNLRIDTNELSSDTRTPALTSRTDPQVEALGEVYRAKVAGGKG